jgi:hypothetical protein
MNLNTIFLSRIYPNAAGVLGVKYMRYRSHFDETTVQFFTPGEVDELALRILILYNARVRLADLARNITKFIERYYWPYYQMNYLQWENRVIERRD